MRKKHKIYQSPTVRIQSVPKAFVPSVSVFNLQEQKDRFLKHGKTPVFVVQGDTTSVEELAAKTSGKIRFDLLGEAEYILRLVKQQYGVGENYLEHIYGPRIQQDEANEILFDYIRENSLQESLSVYWSNEMTCSARMVWKGHSFKCNKPETRRYSLWLNGTDENPYLRRQGLQCLLDHEIGTHFYRSYNDGLQPWFYDRRKFGLRGCGSFESLCTEEGLAAVNTTLRAKEKYLWLSALVYYTACKSTEMTFKQLFDHLGQFVHNPEQRWKHVMRVKRGLIDPNDLGGYGKDQCYFEGAVTILRNIDNINFNLLMSGKICYDEVSRVKRVARLGSVCLPAIMQNMEDYRKQLKKMAEINGLYLPHPAFEPPRAYLQRLKERKAGIRRRKKVRKMKKLQGSLSTVSCSESEDTKDCIQKSKQARDAEIYAKYSCPDPKTVSPSDSDSGSGAKDSCSDSSFSGPDIADSDLAAAADVSCSKPHSRLLTNDHLTTQLFVNKFNNDLDERCTLTSLGKVATLLETAGKDKQQPSNPKELKTPKLPLLSEKSVDKHSFTPVSRETTPCSKTRDLGSTSSLVFEGLCNIFVDSSSMDQFNIDENIESWLLTASSSSVSKVKSENLPVPKIIAEKMNGNSGVRSYIHGQASSEPNLDTYCSSSTGAASPSSSCPTKGKQSCISIRDPCVTQELAIKSSLPFASSRPRMSMKK